MKKILDIFNNSQQEVEWKRKPRIKTDYLKKISFTLPEFNLKNDFKIWLSNISTSGVAFKFEGSNEQFIVGDKVSVVFSIYENECPVNVEVVRVDDDTIGCRLLNNISRFSELISKFYKIELSAADMSHVDSQRLNPKKHGDPHWYHGDNNCELYFVERNDKILNFHITFFGNAIEFGVDGRMVYGHVWDEERDKDIAYKGSKLIKVVDKMEDEILEESKGFVRQIPLLDDHFKQQIIEIIESHTSEQVA